MRCALQDANNTAAQTVLTNVQLDPGSAEYLQPVISNVTNITMLTSTLAVGCLLPHSIIFASEI